MRHAVTLLAAFALGALFGSNAIAQTISGVAGDTAALTTALTQESPGLAVSLKASGVYDSNVARVSAAEAAKEGLKLQDEIFEPALTVDFLRPIGPGDFFLSGAAGYQFYDRNTILNRELINLNSGYQAAVGPCKGDLVAGYERYQSNLDDLTIGVVRNVVDDKSIVFNGSCPRQIGFGPTVSLSEEGTDNSNAQEVPSNFNTFTGTAGIAYTRPTFGELSVFGEYDDTEFPDRLVPVGAGIGRDDYQLYAASVRYDRRLGARIEGVVSLSYSWLDPNTVIIPKFAGPTYSADVTFRATGKITAHAHAERALEPAIQIDTTYTIKQNYVVEVMYAMNSRLSATIGGASLKEDFKGSALIIPTVLTHETIDDLYGTVTVDVGRRVVLALDVRQEDRAATPAFYNYDSTRVTLTARAKF